MAKRRGHPLVGATQWKGKLEPGLGVTGSAKLATVINARQAHHQKVGQLERQHQWATAGQLVMTMHVIKKGKTATTETPVGGVGGIHSTVCPIVEYSQLFEHLADLAQHCGDCHKPYMWYFCTLCDNQQKSG